MVDLWPDTEQELEDATWLERVGIEGWIGLSSDESLLKDLGEQTVARLGARVFVVRSSPHGSRPGRTGHPAPRRDPRLGRHDPGAVHRRRSIRSNPFAVAEMSSRRSRLSLAKELGGGATFSVGVPARAQPTL
jgi:hypothetical protein